MTSTSGAASSGGRRSAPHDVVAQVEDLSVTFRRGGELVPALRGVTLTIGNGEIVALVGESGSGKSMLGMSLLGLLPNRPAPEVTGSVTVGGADMITSTAAARRRVRRAYLGAIFQDPMTSLNPTMRIGAQVREAGESGTDVTGLLRAVGIPDPAQRLRSFPHELSGGMRQRVMIAMAVATNPALVVADEPTTALDVTVQAQVTDLLKRLRDEFGCSFLLITHDLGVASEVADRIAVLYAGRLAEIGPAAQLLGSPRHPYTAALLQSRIDPAADRTRLLPTLPGEPPNPMSLPPGCAFAPRCPLAVGDCDAALPELAWQGERAAACIRSELTATLSMRQERAEWAPAGSLPDSPGANHSAARMTGVEKRFRVSTSLRQRAWLYALRGVDLEIGAGQAVALVGESGSGKSTLLRAVAGLEVPDGGRIDLAGDARPQVVYQDAGASLTPWLTVGELLEERLGHGRWQRDERRNRVLAVLSQLGLPAGVAAVRAGQLSGGQRQRVALARAIVVPPKLLLCDEPTSALDASLASTVINLIGQIRRELGMAVLFVTHDLSAAAVVADRIAVLYAGRIVEAGPSARIIADARHPYTKMLLDSLPRPGRPANAARGEPASPLAPPPGCAFHPRCPVAVDGCPSHGPYLIPVPAGAPVASDASADAEGSHLADCVHLEPVA